MAVQLLINLTIATLWMFLNDTFDPVTFFSGYLVGLVILFSMRRFFSTSFYFIKIYAILKLVTIFTYELIQSSILVVRQIMKPKLDITPGIFKIQTELEGEWEVSLLALLLTLTPGSVVLEISQDGKEFTMHAMDIPISSDSVRKTKETFEKAIMEVTR
ncbi:Na+/H+ antiporter subunit E [Sutcliffiella rhizosphaerae]|uniref:Na+/H+ antiporter subunit E n=1 Tax=Sutcliffiella rhizosphaerae TaxID=2880967 RepID=UPI001E38D54D|nr:Na+/H+ antiporter subunit E [Sutcliffiella rhizosphaerae]